MSIDGEYYGEDIFDLFIDQLVVEAGMVDLEPDVMAEMKKCMKTSLERRINAAMLKRLSPRKLKKFDKMLDKEPDARTFRDFLMKNIPNLDEIVTSVMSDFRKEYVKPS